MSIWKAAEENASAEPSIEETMKRAGWTDVSGSCRLLLISLITLFGIKSAHRPLHKANLCTHSFTGQGDNVLTDRGNQELQLLFFHLADDAVVPHCWHRPCNCCGWIAGGCFPCSVPETKRLEQGRLQACIAASLSRLVFVFVQNLARRQCTV